MPGLDVLPVKLHTLDRALAAYLESDEALPLSFPIAGLLNLMATQVHPLAVNGPHLSPFARLSYAEKAQAFELIERTDADLVALLDLQFPEPFKASVSGLLKFVGGALIEFATFGAYGESAVYDKVSRTLRKRPVGWNHTGYQPHQLRRVSTVERQLLNSLLVDDVPQRRRRRIDGGKFCAYRHCLGSCPHIERCIVTSNVVYLKPDAFGSMALETGSFNLDVV